jgi:hypothetical protein
MSIPEKRREPLSAEDEIRALLEEGRIYEAKKRLESAGDLVPADSPLREIFAPPRIRRVDERDVDRTPEFNWLRANWDAYEGKWVALVGDDLVACSDTSEGLFAQLDGRRFEHSPLVHHIID